jgi:hypothetical protein
VDRGRGQREVRDGPREVRDGQREVRDEARHVETQEGQMGKRDRRGRHDKHTQRKKHAVVQKYSTDRHTDDTTDTVGKDTQG